MCKLKNYYGLGSQNKILVLRRSFYEHPRLNGTSISCSSGKAKDPYALTSDVNLSEADILYCAAPAMGHNQVY